MVTVHRLGQFKLQVYADDHLPPHCHIIGPDFEAVVSISDLSILRGERHSRELAEALRWMKDHAAELAEAWAKIND